MTTLQKSDRSFHKRFLLSTVAVLTALTLTSLSPGCQSIPVKSSSAANFGSWR
ncbi:hypothetical protein [Fischerella thermalis]|uniref:hypothetical protein n=1 Tax=Fischerella thermalis TaxID=372787 RepID=UPI0015E11C80|nr:hypothetical protein [Fischerella thermalis]